LFFIAVSGMDLFESPGRAPAGKSLDEEGPSSNIHQFLINMRDQDEQNVDGLMTILSSGQRIKMEQGGTGYRFVPFCHEIVSCGNAHFP